MSKPKKNKYRPLRADDVIDLSVSLSQAAALLDKAAEQALLYEDEYQLLQIADRWITIGKIFTDQPDSDIEHVDTNGNVVPFGFAKTEEVKEDD